MMKDMFIIHGNTNEALAHTVAKSLNCHIISNCVKRFSDGEVMVEINENVRGKHACIIQSTCDPVNTSLMEILLIADALKRASVTYITVVIPYFGYARQDRRPRSSRVPISAKLIANLIAVAGISRVVTVDLHADQIQGFFDIPVDNIYFSKLIMEDLINHPSKNPVIVSPDIGGLVRARSIAKQFKDSDIAIVDKRRQKANQVEVMNIIGDVKDKDCFIIDDIVDTAGTLCKAAAFLKEKGAKKIISYCTHPVLSGKAIENLENSPIDTLKVANSIPLNTESKKSSKIEVLDIGPMLAETLHRISLSKSVSDMF
ncbi:MAG: ribose-phosphate pyrophosphokinase [Pseudomonadota bacterium]|nr:ribose-phosphate pyrophosphokinase [Pseudomonadota bacterium]